MNYDSINFRDRDLSFRFPNETLGFREWQSFANEIPTQSPIFTRTTIQLKTPRIFISYKSIDRQKALRLAYLANQAGFNYWMDVFDPTLSTINKPTIPLTTRQKIILIATIIEIALMNTSHIIATVTQNTASSRWVPYEFGRVKDKSITVNEASSWISSSLQVQPPEYLYLCPVHTSEIEIRTWLTQERNIWEQTHNVKLRCPAAQWNLLTPQPL